MHGRFPVNFGSCVSVKVTFWLQIWGPEALLMSNTERELLESFTVATAFRRVSGNPTGIAAADLVRANFRELTQHVQK